MVNSNTLTAINLMHDISKICMIDDTFKNIPQDIEDRYENVKEYLSNHSRNIIPMLLSKYTDLQLVDSSNIASKFLNLFDLHWQDEIYSSRPEVVAIELKNQIINMYKSMGVEPGNWYYHNTEGFTYATYSTCISCCYYSSDYTFAFDWFWGRYKNNQFEFYPESMFMIVYKLYNRSTNLLIY